MEYLGDVPDEFNAGFTRGDEAANYDIPETAIANPDVEATEPTDDPDPELGESITAPGSGEAVPAWVDEAIEASLTASTGDGGDQDPPSDVHVGIGESPEEGTALDMPEEEQTEAMVELERFAIGGESYENEFVVYTDGERHDLTDAGFMRAVPPAALAEEGIEYEVTVTTVQPSEDGDYFIGVQAVRYLPVERMQFTDDGEQLVPQIIEGEETKVVSFTQRAGADRPIIEAETVLMAPHRQSTDIDPDDNPVNHRVTFDTARPLLSLREMRGIMRAVVRTTEHPEAYERSPAEEGIKERLDEAQITPLNENGEPRDALIDSETIPETIDDLPEQERQDLQRELEKCARDGRGFVSATSLSDPTPVTGYSNDVHPTEFATDNLQYDELHVQLLEQSSGTHIVTASLYRRINCAVDIPTDDGADIHREVRGAETKRVTFATQQIAPGTMPVSLMTAGTSVSAPYAPRRLQDANPVIRDDNGILLTLDEARNLLNLLRRTNNT